MDNGDKYLWKYLLEKGDVVRDWCVYTGWAVDAKKTLDCRDAIEDYGIDFKKTKPVDQDQESVFVSTYDDNDWEEVLTGTLVTGDGRKWKWGMQFDDAKSLLDIIAEALPDPFEDM